MGTTADPRLRVVKYRGYLTACRVLGTLALLAILFRTQLEANDQWNSSVSVLCWSMLIVTGVLEFWLRRQTRP